MRGARWSGVAVVAAVLVLAAAPGGGPARAADQLEEQAGFLTTLELAKGHLEASREVLAAGEPIRAGVHAAHPLQELGNRLFGPIARVDRALADRTREAVRRVGRAIERKAPAAEAERAFAEALAALDEAAARVVPEPERSRPALQARVIRGLLDAALEEYDEAYADGRIVVNIEYQDACGFQRRARALYDAARPRLWPGQPARAAAVDAHFATLAKAMPDTRIPSAPMPVERVEAAVDAIGRELDAVAAGAR